MAGIVDPTKAGKYPVVLSDALLGKDPKEIFTGVRYNHKPSLSSPTAPAQARLKSSSTKKGVSYDLSFQDDGGRYQYKGTRGTEDSQFVLLFDAAREVFVLHKVDSMFNMNLVQTPSNDDPDSLRKEFTQLESHKSSGGAKAASRQSAKANNEDKKTTAKSRKPAPKPKAEEKQSQVVPEKKPPPKPTNTKATKKQRAASAESEEDSSDDDLGITIENPGGAAPNVSRDFSPNLFGIRPFSDFVQQNEEEEEDDADGEEDDDDYEHFKLPSPINRQEPERSAPQQLPQPDEDEEEDEEMEDVPQPVEAEEPALDEEDLEAALLEELEGAQESDVSEEE
ncbi:RNA polymerase II transcription elongation factor-domain-containing protein [Hypoxylon fuscum]|nr:RNA polymerase II transcription elongation factor-domain-containing protein [Hypoxylon fuscum]